MADFWKLGALVAQWMFFLGVVYLSYRYIWKNSMPNLFYRGRGSLEGQYAAKPLLGKGDKTSVRIGSDVYQGTMLIALTEQGLYLQPHFFRLSNKALLIPYSRLELVKQPRERIKLFSVRTFGIFKVDGVHLWLDVPYARQVMSRLTP